MLRATRRFVLATGLALGLAAQGAQAQSLLVDGFNLPMPGGALLLASRLRRRAAM